MVPCFRRQRRIHYPVFSAKPDSTPVTIYDEKQTPRVFPEPQYRYIIPGMERSGATCGNEPGR